MNFCAVNHGEWSFVSLTILLGVGFVNSKEYLNRYFRYLMRYTQREDRLMIVHCGLKVYFYSNCPQPLYQASRHIGKRINLIWEEVSTLFPEGI